MYEKTDRKRLYWLIDEYLSNRINSSKFCDEFYLSYSLGLDHSILTPVEKSEFSSLDEIVSRFSEFEEDHRLDARAFSNSSELLKKIIEVKNRLGNH